VKYFWQGIID